MKRDLNPATLKYCTRETLNIVEKYTNAKWYERWNVRHKGRKLYSTLSKINRCIQPTTTGSSAQTIIDCILTGKTKLANSFGRHPQPPAATIAKQSRISDIYSIPALSIYKLGTNYSTEGNWIPNYIPRNTI
ncbi:hypothetical protein CHS0354_021867 [Potamilus streckersoni]|uniref:Uncharacterized protein n=1 Tax=Potamilus streckersoni TaxID=2493646 RepID=A0AAE0TJQ5_9BIVA|nr:hypothetical protein CHS0354_021867 [Potamilus streckersoni]